MIVYLFTYLGWKLGPCLVFFFWSLNFRHLSLITLKYHVCLVPSLTFHHLIFFTLFMGPIPITQCSFFSFFFLQYPNSSNLVKKRRKRRRSRNPEQTEPVKEEGKKKRKKEEEATQEKKEPNSQPRKERKKKKSKGGQKVQLSTVCGSPMCV